MSDPFSYGGMAAAAPPQPQYSQPNPYQQPPPQQYAQQQYAQQQYAQQQPPQQQYAQQQPPQQQPQQQQQQQMVVASQSSNPYAGIVPPQQQPQQASPWDALPAAAPAPSFGSAPAAAANPFDPFATAPPAPAPAPVVAPAPAPQPAPAPPQQQSYAAVQDPWAAAAPPPAPTPQQQQQYQAPAPAPAPTDYQKQPSYSASNTYGPPPPSNQSYGNNDNYGQIVPAGAANGGVSPDKNYENKDPRNPYSQALTQQVSGSKASGLPKAELVGKKGFVMSRISFRTIVMKKWKQSFWVQYGGHTMLWFRSSQDFQDWLNNPYHTQLQRNFLIKLAINFVHDLYKPNVRGYQVTQCRTKPYGKNKVVRQFKLERWMDYGPTIAAAFGSYDPKEVDACREAIVECMKNTPLDNGIRATGAVKEHHERQLQQELRKDQEKRQPELQNGGSGGPRQNGGAYKNYSVGANGSAPMTRSMDDFDLLGDNNRASMIDDSASVPPGAYASKPAGDLFGRGALVPAVNPNPSYPGAPAAPANNGFAQPAFYPQQQPAAQPQAATDPWGAPAPAAPQQQQQQPQYPAQAPAPAFAQAPQTNYGGYPYQQQQQQRPPQMQQQATGGYPAASYPVPTQQF